MSLLGETEDRMVQTGPYSIGPAHIRRFHKASGYKGNRWQYEVGLYGYGFQNGVSCASPF